ncbi:MAG TPA: tRNA adenosine(34) deaminase TadA, partial [Bdellovibrio sp.]|nr:tRNA adenosine(34) deaminase TadA [Bdellovibrio sp.]
NKEAPAGQPPIPLTRRASKRYGVPGMSEGMGYEDDLKWMGRALELAWKAALRGEVPVGAVLLSPEGEVLSEAGNLRETLTSTLGHAELAAIHRASKKVGSWRLEDCTLYVTLEPCVMCAGAIQQARIGRLVYGARDPKGGAVQSLYRVLEDPRLNHQVEVTAGILEKECAEVLSDFFQNRRDEIKTEKSQKKYRRRASVVVVHQGQILGFHAVDPTSQAKYFFIPGGGIENGESPVMTAERETFEETGYKIRVLEDSAFHRKYDFFWNGKVHHCDTVFYLGVLDEEWHPVRKVRDADYHRGVAWIELKTIDQVFAYDSNILWAVRKLVKLARRQRS